MADKFVPENIGQVPLFQLQGEISKQLEVFDVYGLGIYIPGAVKNIVKTFRKYQGKLPPDQDIPSGDIRTRDL